MPGLPVNIYCRIPHRAGIFPVRAAVHTAAPLSPTSMSRHATGAFLTLTLVSILAVPALHAQPVSSTPTEHHVKALPAGAVQARATWGDSLRTFVFDPDAEVRLIVVFEAPALARARAESGAGKTVDVAAAEAVITAEHERFRADVAAYEAAASKRAGAPSTEIRRAYRTALNGVAVTTRRGMGAWMASLPYVRGVYEDRTVTARSGTPGLKAAGKALRPVPGATGAGIVVAVIDTGVDYTHPAFGGFGPTAKVLGGYDFIDEDADPMDENGHGTHVAGIIAGNDPAGFTGVAPDARLLAYRVLDAGGNGPTSGVIAAIERALDPDGNPATDDAVDVMNLSLGAPGHPDDPGARAIDNATAAGVVCVVAAGNNGRSFGIDSPGAARSALTVGASDSHDQIATFSSRGPASPTFENKPDVLAPGVDIVSALPGGQYGPLSGTSMATPYVAGTVALLLERHPGWSPAVVKAALLLSAYDTQRKAASATTRSSTTQSWRSRISTNCTLPSTAATLTTDGSAPAPGWPSTPTSRPPAHTTPTRPISAASRSRRTAPLPTPSTRRKKAPSRSSCRTRTTRVESGQGRWRRRSSPSGAWVRRRGRR